MSAPRRGSCYMSHEDAIEAINILRKSLTELWRYVGTGDRDMAELALGDGIAALIDLECHENSGYDDLLAVVAEEVADAH